MNIEVKRPGEVRTPSVTQQPVGQPPRPGGPEPRGTSGLHRAPEIPPVRPSGPGIRAVVPPTRSTYEEMPGVGLVEQRRFTDDIYNNFESIIQRSPDPDETRARLGSALFLSERMNAPPSTVFQHLDRFSEQYIGSITPPKTLWQAIGDEFHNAQLGVWRGRIGTDILAGAKSYEDVAEELERIQTMFKQPDNVSRALHERILISAARFLPTIGATQRQSMEAGMMGAGLFMAGALFAIPEPVTSLMGAALVATASIKGYGVGRSVGAFTGYMQISSGNTYLDTLQMLHDNREQLPISEEQADRVAKATALVSGAAAAALAPLAVKRLGHGSQYVEKLLPKAVQDAILRLAITPYMENGVKFLQTYGASILEGTVEEIFQEFSERLGTEVWAEIMEGLGDDVQLDGRWDQDDWVRLFQDTVVNTAQGQMLLALPGSASAGMAASRAGAASRAQQRAAREGFQQRIAEVYAETTEDMRRQFSGIHDRFLDTLERYRVSGDKAQLNTLESLNKEMEELERLMVDESAMPEDQQIHRLSREQWLEATEAIPQRDFLETETAQNLKQTIAQNMPNLSEQQADASVLLLQMRSDAAGMNLNTYVNEYFAEGIFSDPNSPLYQSIEAREDVSGAATFLEDGRAIITATSRANFSTWVHEAAHVFRRQLDPQLEKIAAEWAGIDVTEEGFQWTEEAEEAFAEAFEDYVREGIAPNAETASLFRIMARWLRQIYQTAQSRWEISDDIRDVYGKLLTRAPAQSAASSGGIGTMHQTSAFHGTRHLFDSFDISRIGTGEGAQYFGWGLYFSERRGVAKWYAESIAGDVQRGAVIKAGLSEFNTASMRTGAPYLHQLMTIVEFAQAGDISYEKALSNLELLHVEVSRVLNTEKREASPDAEIVEDFTRMRDFIDDAMIHIDEGGSFDLFDSVPQRVIYDVLLNKDADDVWLNHTETISVESDPQLYGRLLEAVSNRATAKVGNQIYNQIAEGNLTGGQLYSLLSKALGSDQMASEALRDAGFDGIQFPIGTVMGDTDISGYNYVVFDDAKVQIIDTTVFQTGYHGTDRAFMKFSTDAIGTGLGKQVSGWGLYFLGPHGSQVARDYADRVSRKRIQRPVTIDGRDINIGNAEISQQINHQIYYRSQKVDFPSADIARQVISENIGNFQRQILSNEQMIQVAEQNFPGAVPRLSEEIATMRQALEDANRVLQDIRDDSEIRAIGQRVVYEVDIQGSNAQEPHFVYYKEMLDAEDYTAIEEGLRERGLHSEAERVGQRRGKSTGTMERIYRDVLEAALGSDQAASLFLAEVGIEGFVVPSGYHSEDGSGVPIYVVFDEGAIKIRDRTLFQTTPRSPTVKQFLSMADTADPIIIDARAENAGEIVTRAVDRGAERMTSELIQAFEQGNEQVMVAERWYDELERAFKDFLEAEIPQIQDAHTRVLFSAFMGVFSNGQKMKPNVWNAVSAFKYFLRTGEMPIIQAWNSTKQDRVAILAISETRKLSTAVGARADNAEKQLRNIEELVNRLGEEGAADWLAGEHTGREIAEFFNQRDNQGNLKKIASLPYNQSFNGVEILGPKLGQFAMAFTGVAPKPVKDVWFTRTWNRYMGTPFQSYNTTTEMLAKAETAEKEAEMLAGTPRGDMERGAMDMAVQRTADALSNHLGRPISIHQVQAMLWFLEKQLYADVDSAVEFLGPYEVFQERQASLQEEGSYVPIGEDLAPIEQLVREQKLLKAQGRGKARAMKPRQPLKMRPRKDGTMEFYTPADEGMTGRAQIILEQYGDDYVADKYVTLFQNVLDGQVSFESRPGSSTGDSFAWMDHLTYDEQSVLLNRVDTLLDQEGYYGQIAERLGITVRDRRQLPGAWMGETNPSMQLFIEGSPTAAALDAYASIIGKLLMQDGMGWHRPTQMDSGDNVYVDLGHDLSSEEAAAIVEIAEARYGEDVAVISGDRGFRLLNFSGIEGEAFAYQIADMLEILGYDENVRIGLFAGEGNLIENDWRDNPSGQTYDSTADAAGHEAANTRRWADRVLAPKTQKIYRDFASEYRDTVEQRRQGIERTVGVPARNTLLQSKKPTAFWAYGNQIRGVRDTHIADVLKSPAKFGFTRAQLENAYAAHGEELGYEGRARDGIIKSLLEDRWIRARWYDRGGRGLWSITVHDAGRQWKSISNWLMWALEEGVINERSKIEVQSTSSGTVETYRTLREFYEQGDTLMQRSHVDEHYVAVEEAVRRGQWVSGDVLRQYATQEWAAEEVQRRDSLAREAVLFETVGEFIDFAATTDPSFGTQEYYGEIWDMAQRSFSEGAQNQAFVQGINPDLLAAFLLDAGEEAMLPADWENAYRRVRSGKQLTSRQVDMLMNELRKDPSKFRRVADTVKGERAELLSAIAENAVAVDQAKEITSLRGEVADLIAKDDSLNRTLAEINAEMDALRLRIHEANERLSEDYQEHREDLDSLKQDKAAAHDALRAAREEALLQLREAKKKMREASKVRALQKKYIRRIMRKPSGAIHRDAAAQLRAVQSRMVAHKTKSTKLVEEALQHAAGEGFEVAADVLREQYSKQALDEMSIENLEELDALIEDLRSEGREARSAELNEQRARRQESKSKIIETIGGVPRDQFERGRFRGSRESRLARRKPLTTAYLATLRMERFARLLDGDRKGEVYRLLWTEVNRSENRVLEHIHRRMAEGKAMRKELGITTRSLTQNITYQGNTYNTDSVIGIYVAMQNPNSRAAVEHGNKISPEVIEGLIAQLDENHKAWGDWMVDSFSGESYERIAAAVGSVYNAGMEKVDRYFPMFREELPGDPAVNLDVAEEIRSRSNHSRAYQRAGFKEKRIEIRPEHQTPIQLQATSIWANAISQQEKFAGSAELVRDLHNIFGDRDVREAITQKFGSTTNDLILGYINAFTNPNFYKTGDGLSRLSRFLRGNMAISYLAFNAVTVLKQAPSLGLFLAESGPVHLISAMAKFSASPAQMIRDTHARDPQMAERSIARYIEELKLEDRNAIYRAIKKVGTAGMYGIMAMDKAVTTIGWNAVYDSQIAHGASQAEAIEAAQNAVLRTQPAARAKDLASIYRSNEGFNWFLMFSNQLNQIWNITAYDIPSAVKNGEIMYAMSMATGVALSGLAIGVISKAAMPEDWEETGEMILSQMISSIPFLGREVQSGMDGWFGTGVDPLPIARSTGLAIRSFREDMPSDKQQAAVARMLENALVMAGVPTVAPRRVKNTIEERDLWELLGGRE